MNIFCNSHNKSENPFIGSFKERRQHDRSHLLKLDFDDALITFPFLWCNALTKATSRREELILADSSRGSRTATTVHHGKKGMAAWLWGWPGSQGAEQLHFICTERKNRKWCQAKNPASQPVSCQISVGVWSGAMYINAKFGILRSACCPDERILMYTGLCCVNLACQVKLIKGKNMRLGGREGKVGLEVSGKDEGEGERRWREEETSMRPDGSWWACGHKWILRTGYWNESAQVRLKHQVIKDI